MLTIMGGQTSGVDLTECPEIQVDNQIQSNNNLGPEESEYTNAGIVYSGLITGISV